MITGAIYLAITTSLTLVQLFLEHWTDYQTRGVSRARRRRLALEELVQSKENVG